MTSAWQNTLAARADYAEEQGKQEQADELRLLAGRNADGTLADSDGVLAQARPSARVGRLFSDVEKRSVDWLWPGRIPLERMTILYGPDGLGKSTVACDIAARVTMGAPMPDGSPTIMGNVIFISVEDESDITTVDRLGKLGADLSRVLDLSTDIPHAVVRPDDEAEGPFRVPDDLPLLRQKVIEFGAVLVVLDPFMGIVNSRHSTARNQSVRQIVYQIERIGHDTGAAILMVAHPTKANVLQGSSGLHHAARSIMKLIPEPGQLNVARLIHEKCNIAPKAPQIRIIHRDDDTLEYEGGETAAVLLKKEAQTRSQGRSLVLDLLNTPPYDFLSGPVIATRTGIVYGTVRSHLTRLKDDGLVWNPYNGMWQSILGKPSEKGVDVCNTIHATQQMQQSPVAAAGVQAPILHATASGGDNGSASAQTVRLEEAAPAASNGTAPKAA